MDNKLIFHQNLTFAVYKRCSVDNFNHSYPFPPWVKVDTLPPRNSFVSRVEELLLAAQLLFISLCWSASPSVTLNVIFSVGILDFSEDSLYQKASSIFMVGVIL